MRFAARKTVDPFDRNYCWFEGGVVVSGGDVVFGGVLCGAGLVVSGAVVRGVVAVVVGSSRGNNRATSSTTTTTAPINHHIRLSMPASKISPVSEQNVRRARMFRTALRSHYGGSAHNRSAAHARAFNSRLAGEFLASVWWRGGQRRRWAYRQAPAPLAHEDPEPYPCQGVPHVRITQCSDWGLESHGAKEGAAERQRKEGRKTQESRARLAPDAPCRSSCATRADGRSGYPRYRCSSRREPRHKGRRSRRRLSWSRALRSTFHGELR